MPSGDLDGFVAHQNIAAFLTKTQFPFLGPPQKTLFGDGIMVDVMLEKMFNYTFKYGCRHDEIVYQDNHINVVLGDAMRTMVDMGMAGPSEKYISERTRCSFPSSPSSS